MNTMKKLILATAILLVTISVNAESLQEAIRNAINAKTICIPVSQYNNASNMLWWQLNQIETLKAEVTYWKAQAGK